MCDQPNVVPCKGYKQCIPNEWLTDGKKDCLDESDEGNQKMQCSKSFVTEVYCIWFVDSEYAKLVRLGGGKSYDFSKPQVSELRMKG